MTDENRAWGLIQNNRERLFVGRRRQLSYFENVLNGEIPCRFVYLEGIGGVGKSTLLYAFERLSARYGRRRLWTNCREGIESPDDLLDAMLAGLPFDADDLFEALGNSGESWLLVLDSLEHINHLQGWIRKELLPSLPPQVLVCFGGRKPLEPEWKSDDVVAPQLKCFHLDNFNRDVAGEYLDRQNIPRAHHQELVSATFGHPLTLALAVDVFQQTSRTLSSGLAESPRLLESLLAELVRDVPSDYHYRVLILAASVMHLTAELARCVVGPDHVEDTYKWLRKLSFVDNTPKGLSLHSLIREIILSKFKKSGAPYLGELVQQAIGHYIGPQYLESYEHLHEWVEETGFLLEHFHPTQRAGDDKFSLSFLSGKEADDPAWAPMEEMILAHEGEESLEMFRFWRGRAGSIGVVRDRSESVAGFFMALHTREIDAAETARDPFMRVAYQELAREGALAEGEDNVVINYWMGRDVYQALSPVRTFMITRICQHFLSDPGIRYGMFKLRDPNDWYLTVLSEAFRPYPEGGFYVNGTWYCFGGNDYRRLPLGDWLKEALAQAARYIPSEGKPGREFTREEFDREVKHALRVACQPKELERSPLTESRMVLYRSGLEATPARRAEVLFDVLRESCERLQKTPGQPLAGECLIKTYLEPLGKQETVAEALGLKYGTYQRALSDARDALCAELWWCNRVYFFAG